MTEGTAHKYKDPRTDICTRGRAKFAVRAFPPTACACTPTPNPIPQPLGQRKWQCWALHARHWATGPAPLPQPTCRLRSVPSPSGVSCRPTNSRMLTQCVHASPSVGTTWRPELTSGPALLPPAAGRPCRGEGWGWAGAGGGRHGWMGARALAGVARSGSRFGSGQ